MHAEMPAPPPPGTRQRPPWDQRPPRTRQTPPTPPDQADTAPRDQADTPWTRQTPPDVTVSHAIVILLTLTCQLAPKSNSHISQSFVASVYKPAFSNVLHFDIQLQCIQISTRINSSMYICTYVFVSFETTPVIRI